MLTLRNETIAVAESVTSGKVQALLSLAPEASKFFEGGITTYNARQKVRHLGIDPVHALRHNCVSEQVAMEMALGVRRAFVSNWGIGVTGYATTIPEAGIKSLFAFYAVAYENKIVHSQRIDTIENVAAVVQACFAQCVIDGLIHCLECADAAPSSSQTFAPPC